MEVKKDDLSFIRKHFFDEDLIKTEEGPCGVEIGFIEDESCIKLLGFFTPVVGEDKVHPAYNGNTAIVSCILIDRKYSREFSYLVDFLQGNDSVQKAVSEMTLGDWGKTFSGLSRYETMNKIRGMICENTHISVSERHPGEINVVATKSDNQFSEDEFGMLSSTFERCMIGLAKYVLVFPPKRWVEITKSNIREILKNQMFPTMPDEVQERSKDIEKIFARDTMYQLIAIADAITIAVSQWESWKTFVDKFPEHWISTAHRQYCKMIGNDTMSLTPEERIRMQDKESPDAMHGTIN